MAIPAAPADCEPRKTPAGREVLVCRACNWTPGKKRSGPCNGGCDFVTLRK